jgi:hypothetical protein
MHADGGSAAQPPHQMWMLPLGGGWNLMAMAQVFPVITWGAPGESGSPLHRSETYLTQPAAMVNLESPGSRFVFRFTPNFEGLTLPDGELTFGGWGEGFIDKRHPHTLLHEMMLSFNVWNPEGVSFSLSGGRGFATYGTDDPMARPGLKYPTNHHLSQILERWTLNGVVLWRGWSAEAAIFGGEEPTDPWDHFGNLHSFGDSWSARVARRFGEGFGPLAPWEVSASYGVVREVHHGREETTFLTNAAVRHAGSHAFGELYGLVEASRGDTEGDSYFSVLGETQLGIGRHQPYLRVEYATRPEYPRLGAAGSDDFFRYDHDDHAIGATRWLISTLGYGYRGTDFPFSVRPFAELNHHRVSHERGPATLDPQALFGTNSFLSLSAGFRMFVGGGPMRMGAYGVLDPMSAAHAVGGAHAHHQEAGPETDAPHEHRH